MADDVPGEPQLPQADGKSCTVEFKRRVHLRHEELGNISAISRRLSVPADELDNDMECQDTDELFIEVLLSDEQPNPL